MRRQTIILALTFALLSIPALGAETVEKDLKRWFFTGAIDGQQAIQMEFGQSEENPKSWGGFYYYESGDGQRLRLGGSLSADRKFELTAWMPGKTYDDDEVENGRLKGQFDADFTRAEGTWSSPDGQRTLPFTLNQLVRYHQRLELTPYTVDKLPDMECLCEVNRKAGKTPPELCACLAKGDLTYPMLQGGAMEGMRAVGLLNGPSKEDRESGEGVAWGDQLSLEFHSANLISLRADNYFSYYGAAHPMNSTIGVLLGAAEGKPFRQLTLEQIYASDEKCLAKLNEAIHADLAVQEAPAAVDEGDSWGVDLKKLYATTFLYRGGHLVFLYSPYEVGPYAMGPFEAKVPLAKVAECIPGSSPLAPFAPAPAHAPAKPVEKKRK